MKGINIAITLKRKACNSVKKTTRGGVKRLAAHCAAVG
jgi:hypothetical protein